MATVKHEANETDYSGLKVKHYILQIRNKNIRHTQITKALFLQKLLVP